MCNEYKITKGKLLLLERSREAKTTSPYRPKSWEAST